MPKFSYVVKDKDGKSYKDIAEAYTKSSLVDKLHKQGFYVINVRELILTSPEKKRSETKRIKKKREFGHSKVKLDDLIILGRQLGTMLEAGVSLTRSLQVIQTQIDSEKLYQAIVKINGEIEQGNSLSVALSKHPKIFNQFWTSLVEVGEASGTLPQVLNKLTFYLEQQAMFRSTIISGMIYPSILFSVAIFAVIFFALIVAPKFESIFKQMNVDLPMITVVILATFRFVQEKWPMIIGSLIFLIFVFRQFTKTFRGRLLWERFMFQLPTFGQVYRLIIVERVCSQMAILIDAGVPILYALDICTRLVNNYTCSLVIGDIKESVKEGELLVTAIERTQFFPALASQMINVGEETGELSKMFKHVSAFYQEAVERFMKRFSTIIEPFMLIFMGVVIGVIVIAMFLPMFNIARLGGAGGG